MKHHDAPWSRSLIVLSTMTTVLLLGVAAAAWWTAVAGHNSSTPRWVSVLPLLMLFGCALFTIRGYTISSGSIIVHRLFWSTVLPRTGLESAEVDLEAMRGSLRTFGNGGAFSFTGFYYNKRLRTYRAYVTDPHRTVVLRYADRRVVLSPDKPQDFVRDLALAAPNS